MLLQGGYVVLVYFAAAVHIAVYHYWQVEYGEAVVIGIADGIAGTQRTFLLCALLVDYGECAVGLQLAQQLFCGRAGLYAAYAAGLEGAALGLYPGGGVVGAHGVQRRVFIIEGKYVLVLLTGTGALLRAAL